MSIELNPKNEKFHRTIETQQLVKFLLKATEKKILTYEALNVPALGDCSHHGDKNRFLVSARKIVRESYGVEFKAIHNVGIQRMTDAEKVAKSVRTHQQMVRKSKAVISSLFSTKYHGLSAKDKIDHNTGISVMEMVNHVNSPKMVQRVQKLVKTKKKPLSLKEGLREWKRRNQ